MNGFTLVTGIRISSSATPDRKPRLTGPSARRMMRRTPGCCKRNSIQCSANNPTTPATTSHGGAASSTTAGHPPRKDSMVSKKLNAYPRFGERKKTNVTTKNVIVAAQPTGAGGDGRYLDHSAANTIATPCNAPHRTKFQPAPCHKPQNVMVRTIAQKGWITAYARVKN